jgi:hypothetical protein
MQKQPVFISPAPLRSEIELQHCLEVGITERYGPVVSGEPLLRLLAFKNQDAMRRAINRGRLTVPIFRIEHRRGKFALATDLAEWLIVQRSSAIFNQAWQVF